MKNIFENKNIQYLFYKLSLQFQLVEKFFNCFVDFRSI